MLLTWGLILPSVDPVLHKCDKGAHGAVSWVPGLPPWCAKQKKRLNKPSSFALQSCQVNLVCTLGSQNN